MRVVSHSDGLRLVRPADRNEYRAEDFFAREAPIVGCIGEHSRNSKISLRKGPRLRWQAADEYLGSGQLETFLNITTDLTELLFVDNGADVGRLVERVADLELRRFVSELLQEAVEDVGMEE